MAPSHVPSDHLPLQGQNLYADPTYDNLFPSVDQYGITSWNPSQQSNHHPSVATTPASTPTPSPWQQHSFAQHPYGSMNQSYAPPNNAYQTASPYQYGQFTQNTNTGSVGTYVHAPAVDPNLVDHMSSTRQQQQSPYQNAVQNPTPDTQMRTVAPQVLQHGSPSLPVTQKSASPFQIPTSTTELFSRHAALNNAVQPVNNPVYDVTKAKGPNGFTLLDVSALAKANRVIPLNNLVSYGVQPLTFSANRTILPQYNPRHSLNDLKKAGTKDKKVLDKLVKKATPKSLRPATLSKPSASSPSSVKREVSESDSSSESSEEESDYSDEEDEPSPLPASRPDEPNEAVRYDVIKATWASRRYSLAAEKVRTALNDIWEVLNTIQKRWRIDSKTVLEAEEQKKTNELPVLKSRVASGRELLQVALKAMLEYAHPDVLYQMGKNKAFLYLCYQFLANRFKMKDYDGKLSSVIYEVLARCVGTLTNEALEETKLNKALNSMKKNATEQNKKFIQQIFDGADAGSKKAKVSSPPKDEPKTSVTALRPTAQTAARTATDLTGTKKTKTSEIAPTPAKKGPSTTPASKTPAASGVSQKRPGEKPAALPPKARGTQVVNKPSSFFSTLNAVSKKPTPAPVAATNAKPAAQQKTVAVPPKKPASTGPPKKGFSFADTMDLLTPKVEPKVAPKTEKQLPPETPEEKAKRLRKEARRHLRVNFRPDASLVSIRYFHHDPDEELGHDENFIRDAKDRLGEGFMFKQHREMEDDDEDDDPEVSYREWRALSNIDFSRIDLEERKRNFEPYGGGMCQPVCPEKEANQQRENGTLMAYYTHPSDIPPSPREPLDSTDNDAAPARDFGTPPDFVLNRAPKSPAPALPSDFSALFETFKQHAAPNVAPPPAPVPQTTFTLPPPPAGNPPDLAAIMGLLQNIQPAQPAPAMQPAAPAPNVDLSSILASLTASNGNAAPYQAPQAAWPFPVPFPQPPQQSLQPDYSNYLEQQEQTQNQQANGGTKRSHDDSNDSNHGSYKKQKGFRNGPVPHKVIPCKFFKKGQCTKGDSCTFIHEQ